MRKILINKNMPINENFDMVQKFFSIPVSPIKVLLKFSQKPEINHFERAIISLLLHKNYMIDDLSDMLLLQKDLIELIISNLKTKNYIDEQCHVTDSGESAIKNVYQDYKEEVCYVFYDHNRECVLSEYCSGNQLEVHEGGLTSFELKTDAFEETVYYNPINLYIDKKNNNNLNINNIEKNVRNSIFYSKDKTLIDVKVLEVENSIYNMISYAKITKNRNNQFKERSTWNWSVVNPISLQNDERLYRFFYENTQCQAVQKIIADVMEVRRKAVEDNKEENRIYEIIKNSLFDKKVDDFHDIIILPLAKIIRFISSTKATNHQEKLENINRFKEAMVELGDLFEKILYQIARESEFKDLMYYENILTQKRNDNKKILMHFASTIGFDIDENSERLFNVERGQIKHSINYPDNASLAECISWNMTIAMSNNDFYLYKLAEKRPEFLNILYAFKRKVRDKTKHTTIVQEISPQIFIDTMWDLLELGMGYKLDKKILSQIYDEKDTILDFSYAHEQVRSKLGNKLFDSTNTIVVQMKLALVNMYNSYLVGKSNYLQEAYKITEDLVTIIARHIFKNANYMYKPLSLSFSKPDDIVKFLSSHGFNVETDKNIGNELADSLNFEKIENYVENGIRNGFKNAVLRVKVLAIISMMAEKADVVNFFGDYKNLFVLVSTLGYLQRHRQVHSFSKTHADIIVDDVIKLADFSINKTKLLN